MLPKAKHFKGQDYTYCQVKYDGNALICEHHLDGRITLITRRPTDITDKLKWHEVYRLMQASPPGTVVLGELYVDDQPSSMVKTAINEQSEDLRFTVFAVPSYNEQCLHKAMRHAKSYGFRTAPVFPEPPWDLDNLPSNVEGYVYKQSHMTGWFKSKPVETADLVVMAVAESEAATTYGLCKALKCGVYNGDGDLVEIASVSSGLTRSQRIQFIESPPIGEVIEVAYQYVGAKGGLRHPVLVRFRDDKPAKDCKYDEHLLPPA